MMRKRARILGIVAAMMAAGFLGYPAVNGLLLQRLRELDSQTSTLNQSIEDLTNRNKKEKELMERLAGLTEKTFGLEELAASEQLRARLVELVERSGLSRDLFSLQVSDGGVKRDPYKEIGRTVQARGKLDHVVNFLYLLGTDPHMHRLEHMKITPLLGSGEVSLIVKYSTVIPLPPKDVRLPAVASRPAESRPAGGLYGPDRTLYDVISSRDLFRPYIKRREDPPPPATPAVAVAPPRRDDPPRPTASRYRVVSLSDWGNQPEVVVDDVAADRRRAYKVGESLAGGEIVTIDYRPLPLPDNPQLLSPSRVIIRIGPEYWAVEVGWHLADKRLLKPSELPQELQGDGAAAPAPSAADGGPGQTRENG